MGSADKQGKLWGTAVADWAELNEPHHAAYWSAMLDDMDVGQGSVVLDAGCGAGGGLKLALERGARVFGLDASEGMIAYARDHLPDGDFRIGDLEALPYDDDYFDAVMAANSVQYAENPVKALGELRRVCKPTGKVSICSWDVREKNDQRFLQDAVAKLMPEPPKPGGGPFALAEPGKLEAFVESAGLRVVGGESVPMVYHYNDLEELVRVQHSTGPGQIVLGIVGEEKLKQGLAEFYDEYKAEDGRLRLNNLFRFVTAVPA
jgi:SAM-dependent methyltransferase